jgi:hypothetical protein
MQEDLITQFVSARGACMTNSPIARLTAKGFLDTPVNLSAYGQIDIKGNGELACQVFFEWNL